jgi:hypothetical protein
LNKKITLIIISILFLSSFISLISFPSVKATPVSIFQNSVSYKDGYGNPYSLNSNYYNISVFFTAANTAYVTGVTIPLYAHVSSAGGHTTIKPEGYFYGYLTSKNGTIPSDNILEQSSSNNWHILTTVDGITLYSFQFSQTVQLTSGTDYFFVLSINSAQTTGYEANYNYFTIPSATGGSDVSKVKNGAYSWTDASGGYSAVNNFYVVGESYLASTPTPPPISGTVRVNYLINPSLQNANFTLAIPPTTNYIDIDSSQSFFYNDGTTLLFLPKLANGWFFNHYNLTTNSGYNISYPINNWAIVLNSSLGTIWNITLYVSQTPNTIDLTLIDVLHGSIYFQNYVNSVPTGIRYGSGIYNITYGTVLYIATLPDSGYGTDYYTVYANGVTSQVLGVYLTFIASSNCTITPHYYLLSSTGIGGGSGSIWNFLNGFTWQNIVVLIIYIAITAICTYLFAFTGLIAGLDISTVICFITGLLGNLMYPVLGLVIIVNIALIILGSGLLNRRKNGTDA